MKGLSRRVAIGTLVAVVSLVMACARQQQVVVQPVVPADGGMPAGEFTYNLPCKVVSIHPELEGKALLFLWLHGGVHDRPLHTFFKHNHLDNCEADDMITAYLQEHNMKAIALFPLCHKADLEECVTWRECYDDVKRMIDDLVSKELVDARRIYVAGSSDGGRGAWDYAELHPEMFAAAIAMSCSHPRMTTIPVFFFNTSSETDCTSKVQALQQRGSNIVTYRYGADYKHGGDAAECTDAVLKQFFDYHK